MTRSAKQIPGLQRVQAFIIPGWTVLMALALLLGGCAGQQPEDPYQQSKSRKAAESNTALGLEYMNRGQNEVALGKLKKAVKEEPDYAPAHTVMAVLYERIGETQLAGKHYKRAYESDPGDGDVNNNYGTYLCKSGKTKQALEHFRKALDDPFYVSPSIALTNAGSCALASGDLASADDYLRQALKIEPDLPDALMSMAKLQFQQKNFLSARAFIQRFEATAKHSAETLLLAYRIELASGSRSSANKYKRMLETNFSESEQAAEIRRSSGT